MQKFILRRTIQYTESSEVQAADWSAAKELLENGIELDNNGDDVVYDSEIEYIGEVI